MDIPVLISLPIPDKGVKCSRCKMNIFALETPCGADYSTCPICESPCASYVHGDHKLIGKFEDLQDEYDIDEYCCDCNIVFSSGCTHGVNGCTDNIYYGMLVKEYKYADKHDIYDKEETCDSYHDDMINFSGWCYCMDDKYVLPEINNVLDHYLNNDVIEIIKEYVANEVYQGMPKFNSFQHFYDLILNLDLTWMCMCERTGGNIPCQKAYYPIHVDKECYEDRFNHIKKEFLDKINCITPFEYKIRKTFNQQYDDNFNYDGKDEVNELVNDVLKLNTFDDEISNTMSTSRHEHGSVLNRLYSWSEIITTYGQSKDPQVIRHKCVNLVFKNLVFSKRDNQDIVFSAVNYDLSKIKEIFKYICDNKILG